MYELLDAKRIDMWLPKPQHPVPDRQPSLHAGPGDPRQPFVVRWDRAQIRAAGCRIGQKPVVRGVLVVVQVLRLGQPILPHELRVERPAGGRHPWSPVLWSVLWGDAGWAAETGDRRCRFHPTEGGAIDPDTTPENQSIAGSHTHAALAAFCKAHCRTSSPGYTVTHVTS